MDVKDDNLPELAEEEQAALDAFPPCSVRHWIQGEKLNFELNRWEGAGLLGVKEPDHYRFLRGSGSGGVTTCLLYTSPSPRDQRGSRMPSSA